MRSNNFTILILFFTLAVQLPATAQKLDKYYTRHTQEGGDLFFIYANEDFSSDLNKTDFLFDVTYRQGNDSLTINYTYYGKEADPALKINIETADRKIEADASKLFIDFEKKMWVHRYSSVIAFKDFADMISSKVPPEISINTKNGQINFSGSSRKWEKYNEAVSKILYIIDNE